MKIELFFLFLCFSAVLISYMTYNINEYNGNSLELQEINSQKKNYTIDIPTSFNNMIQINNKYLIACEYKPEMYIYNLYLRNKIQNEKIYLINIENNQYKEIAINNYPESVPFHPHSMALYLTPEKNYVLYILNHAINYNYEGQERIEKFKIKFEPKKISLYHEETIILPDEYFLRIESISVLDENTFFFTTNSPLENPRDSDELLNLKSKIKYLRNDLLKIIYPMLNIKKCFIYLYNNANKEISTLEKSQSILYGGLTLDTKRKLLYTIKPTEKKMDIYSLNDIKNPKLIKTINILYVGNNIFYDENEDKIYIGINGKKSEEESIIKNMKKNNDLENVKTFSGYEILNPDNNYGINDLMIMKNDFKWINSAIKVNEKIYLSSIYSKGIFVVEKNK